MNEQQLFALLPKQARHQLRSWLKSLPDADRDRETMAAIHNLRRIYNHVAQ